MDPKVIQILTWVAVLVVVALYALFVVWRFRVDRRKKATQAESDAAMSAAIARTAERLKHETPPFTQRAPEEPAPVEPTTVAGALAGIALPNDLVPLTTMAARPAVGDRVAFWTDTAPAETVGPAFADELERLGYAVTSLDQQSLSAQRDGARLLVVIHPDGRQATIAGEPAFASVPEQSVVIEVWIPA